MTMDRKIAWGKIDAPASRAIFDLLDRRMRAKLEFRKSILWQQRIGEYLGAVGRGDWAALGGWAAKTASGDHYGSGSHFGIITLLMLSGWAPTRFPAKARKALARLVLSECSARGDAFKNDFGYQNDNYPFMALTIEILGGELVGRPDIAARGLEKLRRYSLQMSTLGVTSEFCSPNYCVWHLGPLSLVAAMSRNAEARRRARVWCEFIWFELAQRWHQGLAQLVGPHSRAYTEEIYGAWSYAHTMMHRLTGAPLGLDPLGLGYRTEHHGDHPVAAYFALAPLHLPEWARRIMLEPSRPLAVEALTMAGPSWDGSISLFSSPLSTYSYAAPRWSLASCSRPWNGAWQTNGAIAYWNLTDPPRSLADQRTAYARMLFDDHGPGRPNVYRNNFEGTDIGQIFSGTPVAFQDDGLCCAVQKENSLLLAARPKWCYRRRSAIRQTLLISDFARGLPEIWVAGRRVAALPFRSAKPATVVLKDGPVAIGLRPTAVSDLGRECALEIALEDDHLWLSLWNYKGAERAFTVDELQAVRNGFVWVIEEAGAVTPAALHARLAAAELRDEVDGVYRALSYRDPRVQLGLKVHRDCPDPHLMEVDGKPYQCPVFSSPYVQGGFDRELAVGEARLEANAHPLFLRGDPAGEEYAVYNLAGQPCDWRLRIGRQVLTRSAMGFGCAKIARRGSTWQVSA